MICTLAHLMDFPALALLEFSSIAIGIQAGDAMVKRAPLERIITGTIHPGYYLVLATGDVASVGEAVQTGREISQDALRDHIFLPNVHSGVVAALAGDYQPDWGDALGVIETHTIASAIAAADAGLKGAEVALRQMRLADGLGGKGLVLFTGLVADVEAAVELGTAVIRPHLLRQIVIPQLHGDMWENVNRGNGRFGSHFNWPAF